MMWKLAIIVFLLGLYDANAKTLAWRHCNGCGKNTPQESRGCDLEFDLAAYGEDENDAPRLQVYPGERIDIPVRDLMNDLVPDDFFEGEPLNGFQWKETGLLYYTVGILRPSESIVQEEPVDRFMIYQEIKDSELDNGVLHTYIPALKYEDERYGGRETTIQVSVNANPGNLKGTFPVNYYSLENDNRAYFCADIDVEEEDDRWVDSDLFQWKTGAWGPCIHKETEGRCPYDAAPGSGIQTRVVKCDHPALVSGSEIFIQGYDGSSPETVVPEGSCSGEQILTRTCTPPPCSGGKWSSWASSLQLTDGDSVTIPSGMDGDVVLDQSTPNLNLLEIKSTLRVEDSSAADIKLTADQVSVNGGKLVCGAPEQPWTGTKFEIVLTSQFSDILSRSADTGPFGSSAGLKSVNVKAGGQLLLFGQDGISWTKLHQSAMSGASTIVVDAKETPGWAEGDTILIVNSDFHDISEPDNVAELAVGPSDSTPSGAMSEKRQIKSIQMGNGVATITLDSALEHSHYGRAGPDVIGRRNVDMRSEVVWLSRNIQIRGDEPTSISDLSGYPSFSNLKDLYAQQHADPVHGGHVIAYPTSIVQLKNVEIGPHVGQAGRLARYPLHFHRLKDGGRSSYVDKITIHDSFQRAITIHDTKGMTLTDSSFYNARGHAVFFEDGTEVNNHLEGNIVVDTKPQLAQDLREDTHDDLPSAYWLTNFNNKLLGNVAAGSSRGVGFWFKVDSQSEGELLSHPQAVASSLGAFDDNVAHSNHFSGFWIWHDWYPCARKMNTFHYVEDGPSEFTIFGANSGDLRMDSDVETESGEPLGEFGIVRRNNLEFGGSRCNRQPVQVMRNMLTYKHRDVGTACYLTSTNIEFRDFTSVSDTVAMAFAQVYRDQTGKGGISQIDRQKITGLVVATSNSHGNVLNKDKWCSEMEEKGVPSLDPSRCESECHPWPETSHPSGFPDEEYELVSSSKRYLSGVTLSNEGQVGAQEVSGLTLVDWGASPSCGIIDAQGVHVKPGIGLEFPVGARQIHNVRVLRNNQDVTQDTALGLIARLHANDNYGNHETVFVGPDALGSMRSTFPNGAYAMVPSGEDDLFILPEGEGPNGNGCIEARVDDSLQSDSIDSILCDARDIWLTSFSVDFSYTDLYKSGDGPGELQCTPSLLLRDFAENDEFDRTYAGVGFMEDSGIGRPSESSDFYRYRYPFKAAVGKMYLLDFGIDYFEECASLYVLRNKPTYLTMEKMDYDPKNGDKERSFDLVLAFPADTGYRPNIKHYFDTTMGDYGKLGSGTQIYVPLPSKRKRNLQYVESEDLVYDEECCDDTLFIHVRLGQRIDGKDTAMEMRFSDDFDGDEMDCWRHCDEFPWPFAESFRDTSAARALERVN